VGVNQVYKLPTVTWVSVWDEFFCCHMKGTVTDDRRPTTGHPW